MTPRKTLEDLVRREAENDKFGGRCRMRTGAGRRCKKTVQWLMPICVSRGSWLAALRTGWPRLVRGMQEPKYREVGFCRVHGGVFSARREETYYLYGIGKIGSPTREDDGEYEAAKKAGDEAVRNVFHAVGAQ